MGFLDFFRRKPPIRTLDDLARFVDEQAAFLVQKGIYDYTRARSGHFAKVMLRDPGFQNALDRSRWRAYPLGLAMVGEMIEGLLAPESAQDRRVLLDALKGLVLSVHDGYPQPSSLTTEEWVAGREELALHLDRLTTHPPKRIADIPEPFAERYFAMMPFDKPFLTPDAPTARSFMQLQLIHISEQLRERMDVAGMARLLRGR